jgi:hypothetical protein
VNFIYLILPKTLIKAMPKKTINIKPFATSKKGMAVFLRS